MLGQTIAHYKILVKIGGMGEVYLAHDTKLDRKVARKVLHPCSVLPPELARPRLPKIDEAIEPKAVRRYLARVELICYTSISKTGTIMVG